MTELRELANTELDAVCGGTFDLTLNIPIVTQSNVQTQNATTVFGGNVTQTASNVNWSEIKFN